MKIMMYLGGPVTWENNLARLNLFLLIFEAELISEWAFYEKLVRRSIWSSLNSVMCSAEADKCELLLSFTKNGEFGCITAAEMN